MNNDSELNDILRAALIWAYNKTGVAIKQIEATWVDNSGMMQNSRHLLTYIDIGSAHVDPIPQEDDDEHRE